MSSEYDFLISVGGIPTLVAGASEVDAKKDSKAVAIWNFGWDNRPADVAKAVMEMAVTQSSPMNFGDTEAAVDPVDPEKAVYLWKAEENVRGKLMPAWNQGQVGTCVSFGWARAINDLIKQQEMLEEIETVEEDVATEPIYGGSRVEVGGGSIRGDGSVGAWAAKWVRDWGVLLRKVYGQHDLRKYSEALSRQYGTKGCPDDLEPIAKQFPVRSVAMITSAEEAWNGIGSGYGVPVCSGQGFTSAYDEDGFCNPSGSWNHCMYFRGRVIAKRKGSKQKALICQNSWASYISGNAEFVDAKTGEKIKLPPGSFLVALEVADKMLRARDSFTVSAVNGFPRREMFKFKW